MSWKEWVIDASTEPYGGTFCFCPIEGDVDGDFTVVTGMNYVGGIPRGAKLVAIWHPDGQAAVEEFCERWDDELKALAERSS